MKPKIAVYTIALNEEKHVRRWYESALDADLLLIADTGSTDNTRYFARMLGIQVHQIEVSPWRFDVARNASLALIPEDFDMCIQLDMDEVLQPGWRRVVERAFQDGNFWPRYKHVTSRKGDGSINSFYYHFRIHPRKGFQWIYPIHEVIAPIDEGSKFDRKEIDLEISHLQDRTKPRNSYLHLLETAVREMPNDWRMNHYLNREYFYNGNWLKVLQSGYRCVPISGGWDVERSSTYMWISEAARWLEMLPLAKYWAAKATEAAPDFYEAWHWQAHIAHLMNEWELCFDSAKKIERLKRQTHHLVKPEVWEWWGYDLIALSSSKLELTEFAILYGKKALNGSPQDERLAKNLDFYLENREEPSLSQ